MYCPKEQEYQETYLEPLQSIFQRFPSSFCMISIKKVNAKKKNTTYIYIFRGSLPSFSTLLLAIWNYSALNADVGVCTWVCMCVCRRCSQWVVVETNHFLPQEEINSRLCISNAKSFGSDIFLKIYHYIQFYENIFFLKQASLNANG